MGAKQNRQAPAGGGRLPLPYLPPPLSATMFTAICHVERNPPPSPTATAPPSGLSLPSGPPPTSSATTWTPPSTSTSSSGLIVLKYISDAFSERHRQLLAEIGRASCRERG